jgi:hypothetical protein
MYLLKLICLTIVQFIKQTLLLPLSLVTAFTQRHQRSAFDELEAERLDRIRNPSKYRGK